MTDNDDRYEEILRRIQQRKAQEAAQPKKDALAEALDAVNALGVLEVVKKRPPYGLNAYGPKVFTKAQRLKFALQTTAVQLVASYWTGAIVWYKPKGYGQYETLGLLGIWALAESAGIRFIVGTRQLAFTAPVFNPESYYHHLKRGFSIYYEGEASPPADLPNDRNLYETAYQPAQRLTIRAAIESAVTEWRKSPHL